jgi:hypothetical protein
MSVVEDAVVAECMRILDLAAERGVAVRPLGGTALVLQLGDRWAPAFRRDIKDIDLAVRAGERDALADLLTANGYDANAHFNVVSASRRLLFHEQRSGRQLDVFVDSLAMCHDIPLGERIEADPLTIPLAELLLTKLQIVELNERDYLDMAALLTVFELGDGDSGLINRGRIAELCGRDWGLCHTVELSLAALRGWAVAAAIDAADAATIARRIDELAAVIEAAPKSRRWKLRARLGERARWYEEAEEIDRG